MSPPWAPVRRPEKRSGQGIPNVVTAFGERSTALLCASLTQTPQSPIFACSGAFTFVCICGLTLVRASTDPGADGGGRRNIRPLWAVAAAVLVVCLIGVSNAASQSTAVAASANVTAQLNAARNRVKGLESTVNHSGLACQQAAAIDQQLAFVDDALNQGNLLGARTLLQVSMDLASTNARHGVLSPTTAAQLRRSGGQILRSIPTRGQIAHEFKPTRGRPILALHRCPGGTNDAGATVSEFLRALISHAIAHVPVAGAFLAALVEVLWPGSEQHNVTWDELTAYVDQHINEAIDQKTKEDLDAKLSGLSSVLHNYVLAVQSKDTQVINSEFRNALDALEHDAPSFQPQTRPYLVLPEYTQLQNLLLAQLRDGIVNGASFGLPQNFIDDYKKRIANDIANANKWVSSQIPEAHNHLSWTNDQHSNVNKFNANATLDDTLVPAVADQQYFWQYFDPVKYKPPFDPPPNARVLYTPAFGTIDGNGTPTPQGAGKPPIVHITVWGFDRIDGMQLTYGVGSNPDPRMGGSGGTLNPPKGGSFQVGPLADTRGWVTRVYGKAGDVPQAVGFVFTKGNSETDTGLMGSANPQSTPSYELSFPGEVLAYIKINGVSTFYNSADAIVYGFRYRDSYP